MFAGAGLFLLPNLLLAQVSVLTANYDNSRTNSNLNETTLNPSNVTTATFGKIGSFPVDGQIYAQPLYATGIQIPGVGTRDVVYTVTMHNSVYAIDAGAPASLLPLWQVNLGPAVPSSVLNFTVGDSVQIYTDILPEVGILGTPVIDPGRQAIYVVSETLENGVPIFRMHALSLADGHEMFYGPVVIAAAVPGIGAGSGNGTLQFDAAMHLQRPGLALANGMVYAAFGSHGDAAPFHGWMIGYDAGDLRRQVAAFNSTPNGWGASFWQAGRAPAIDAAGNIIAVTGNGNVTASDFGNSILKLSGRDLSLLDWFTPNNWSELNANDYDLGSVGAILIPSSNQVLTIGKSGNLLLIRSDFMGHHAPWNSATAQSFTANHATVDGIASMALWHRDADSMVYLLEPFGALKSYRIADGRLDWTVQSQSSPTTYTKSAGVVVSANGDSDGTGIVWQSAADLLGRQVPGILHAFDAADLSKELWNSEMMPERDTLGRFAKFVAPTVVNGRVYMPTFSNRLAIYGLLSTASAQDMNEVQVTAVANSASLLQSAISPGEVVAISGAHLGPQSMSLAQIDDKGRAANTWDGTQVLFDGVAAPLLYTSSGEVGAVAPFGIPGPTTQVQVAYRGRLSRPMTFPVAQAAPALFAQDGTGGGQGAILNADGSMNGPDHPAKPGSIVSLFATGLGQTDPVSEDGVLGDRLALPAAHLPVAVLMDGKPVEIQYQGAAPDMMHGFFQINARIPDTIQVPAAGIVNVVIKVGEFRSPNLITLAVDDVR
jgi:uncharacterized protein (TIGR03437 family)